MLVCLVVRHVFTIKLYLYVYVSNTELDVPHSCLLVQRLVSTETSCCLGVSMSIQVYESPPCFVGSPQYSNPARSGASCSWAMLRGLCQHLTHWDSAVASSWSTLLLIHVPTSVFVSSRCGIITPARLNSWSATYETQQLNSRSQWWTDNRATVYRWSNHARSTNVLELLDVLHSYDCSSFDSSSIISAGRCIPLFRHQCLTLSSPIPSRLYTLPYWSDPLFLIFDIRALWRSGLSARAPECPKLKMVGGLDQYGAEPFRQQQFGPASVEGVKDTN